VKIRVLRFFHWFGLGSSPLVLLLVTVLSLLPSSGSAGLISWLPFGDKGAHALAYAALGFCMFCAVAARGETWHPGAVIATNRWRIVAIAGLLIAIGLTIELVQPLFGRSMELLDLVADGIGGILGIAVGILLLALGSYWEERRGG
jgi:VanZ family protein